MVATTTVIVIMIVTVMSTVTVAVTVNVTEIVVEPERGAATAAPCPWTCTWWRTHQGQNPGRRRLQALNQMHDTRLRMSRSHRCCQPTCSSMNCSGGASTMNRGG